MINLGFYKDLKEPIIGLSPMDGITDAAFRAVVDEISHPSILYTEFVPVEGLIRRPEKFKNFLAFEKSKTPTVVQIFGNIPESFAKVVPLLANLGFAGIDINMGCPAKKVADRGSGAGLIKTPELALEIIQQTKEIADKHSLPISVKTRIGYNQANTEEWIGTLVKAEPAVITVHGRTVSQGYSGLADWSEIKKAAKIIHQTKTLVFGNGDIKNISEAKDKIKEYEVDGVLMGRATLGNPWAFINHIPTFKERVQIVLLHSEKYKRLIPTANFFAIRKHFCWYCKGFKNASEIRAKLMTANNFSEIKKVMKTIEMDENFN